jgi:uncharacterized GH25 family protein
MFRTLRIVMLATSCASFISPQMAYAHRNWLLPSSTQVEAGSAWVTVDAAVSENLFDFETNAVKLDGLRITGPDGKPLQAQNPFTGRLRSSFDLNLDKPGTYKINIVTESVLVNYQDKGQAKRWRGAPEAMAREVPATATDVQQTRLYSRLESFVTSGVPNTVALRPQGVGLELLAITHPTELNAGETARFRLLLDGRPVAGLPISVVPGGVRYRGTLQEISLTSDADGAFSVTWPAAGMYWLSASYPNRAMQNGASTTSPPSMAPQRRFTYSGTFEVHLP